MAILASLCPWTHGDRSTLPCLGHLKQLTSCETVREVSPQHEIFSQGEAPHTACFICKGLVKLTRTESDGQRAIVGLRRTGWLVGAAAAVTDMPYTNTAETVTRSTLCFVAKDRLLQAMLTDAPLGQWVSMMFARGLYSGVLSISEKSCLSGRQRLETFLREMVNSMNGRDTGKAVKLPILLKQWEVAQLLALTPQHLSRLIRQMENEGLLARRKGWLVLPEPQRIRKSGASSSIFPL